MVHIGRDPEWLSSSTALSGERLAYSVADAVAATGIGRTTLYALMSTGELPRVKLGNRTLIRSADLERLLQRHIAQPSRSQLSLPKAGSDLSRCNRGNI